MNKTSFGFLPNGQEASLYTIALGDMQASVSDYGAVLVKLLVPDATGKVADVVLGFDDAMGYANCTTYLGATVGRNSNRIGKAQFQLNGKTYQLDGNDNGKLDILVLTQAVQAQGFANAKTALDTAFGVSDVGKAAGWFASIA